MKAVVVERDSATPTLRTLPRPTPDAGEALVRTVRVGIDGTDHEVIAGGHGGFPADDEYMVLGHEAVGVVEEPNDTDLSRGDLVVPTVRRPPDGTSNTYAERGELDMAPEGAYVERGIAGAHGFMAEYFTTPGEFLVPVPETLATTGFLVEPVSNAVKALDHAFAARSAFEWTPESAMVLGNGPLGLLTLALLQDRFDRHYCLGRRDRPDPTIDIIESLGATYVDSRETPVPDVPETYESMDFVYEATGVADHSLAAVHALAPSGIAALLGIPGDRTTDVDLGAFHREMVLENKALIGSVNSSVPHFEAARDALVGFPDEFMNRLITGVYAPERAASAFETGDDVIKSVVDFGTP